MPRAIDHLVLAVRDLDAAADLYTRMGFTVGARNRHPWGTLNRIVQFDGAFLELITTEPGFTMPAPDSPQAPFAGFLAHSLAAREGLAMVVLRSTDAARDHAAFARAGIGIGTPAPFHFAREGRRPDGSTVRVAFTLAFAASPAMPNAGFFVCQQHFPENFWNAELRRHTNTATGIAGVLLAAPEPGSVSPFLAAFTAAAPEEDAARADAVSADAASPDQGALAVGPITVLRPEDARALIGATAGDIAAPRFVGWRLTVRDLEALRASLARSALPHTDHGPRLVISAADAFGAAIVVEEAGA